MAAFFKSLAKKTGYVVAAIIILIAFLVSFSRLLTPILDEHRNEFEKWASTALERPVTIHDVKVSWRGYQPEISLNEVTIFDASTARPTLQIKKISVLVSIFKSLWQRQWVPSGFLLAGTSVNVHQAENGEFSIAELPGLNLAQGTPQTKTDYTTFIEKLSQPSILILEDIDLHYDDAKGKTRYVTIYNLNFKNSSMQHLVFGKIMLHQTIPTRLTVAARWEGAKFDLSTIAIHLYFYISGFSIPEWLPDFTWQNWQIKNGMISGKYWATWEHGGFNKIQSIFQGYNLQLYSTVDKSTHTINRLSGNVGWAKAGKTQVFAGDDILIDLPSRLWPSTGFYLSLDQDTTGKWFPKLVNVSYVDLQDVQSYLQATTTLPENILAALKGLQPSGNLQNVSLNFAGNTANWSQLTASALFTQLTVLQWENFPGINNFAGNLQWDGKEGTITFNTNRAIFQYAKLFANPIAVGQLTGSVKLAQDANHIWHLSAPALQIFNDDAAANVSTTLTFPTGSSPVIDLKGNFTLGKGGHAARYLPLNKFDHGLANWLQEAFLAGEVKSGQAILRGKLSDFPFKDGQGLFLISGNVNNVDLDYGDNWPILRQVTGVLTFTNTKMIIDATHARILNIPVNSVHGEIPDLSADATLTVQSQPIQTDLTDALSFIHASPLERTVGKMFKGVELKGPISVKLGLIIPLKNPDQTKVQGDLAIKQGVMRMKPWNLSLNQLNGDVHFTENSTQSNNLQALLFNKPLSLKLTTDRINNTSIVRANFTNNLSIADLETWLKIPFSKVAKGTTNVTGQVDFAVDAPITINLTTNLVGMAINMPGQYGKAAPTASHFVADMTVAENEPLKVKLTYANLLSAALLLNHQDQKYNLTAANIRLGTGTPTWPAGSGLYITGSIDKIDWDKVKAYVGSSNKAALPGLTLKQVDISTNALNVLGQTLNQVRLQITPAGNSWNLNINSPGIAGQLQIPQNLSSQGTIEAQFQTLRLSTSQSSSKTTSIDVRALPKIDFSARNVSYNNIPIGQVSFRSGHTNNGLSIQNLRIDSPRMNLQASGEWTQYNNNYVTHMQGRMQSDRVSDLLSSFGFDVHNFISTNGSLKFDLSWHDAPYAPELATLNGQLSLDVGKGRIVDIGNQGGAKMDLGRMLSIFSLQTIPRRLTFDFSDVFQKGYSFDSVRGDFTFQNGSAYTSNFRFDGPVAKVDIDGRIGLRNKDFDFTLSVTPYVTSSLPIAATLITGQPLIGLAALAVNTVIGSQVSKVTTYFYSVTGPWSNPNWKSISVPTTGQSRR